MKASDLEMPPQVEINRGIKNYGDYNHSSGKMRINPRLGDVVDTIIHEKLHHNFPGMEHDKVYENAAKIESKMTLPEMAMELLSVHHAAMNQAEERPKANFIEVPRVV